MSILKKVCPVDSECEGLVVWKTVTYCFTHDRLEFDGRIWSPTSTVSMNEDAYKELLAEQDRQRREEEEQR